MRIENAGVDSRLDGRAHELEFDSRRHRRQNAALPPLRIPYNILLAVAQQYHARSSFIAEQTGDARSQAGGDTVEYQYRRHLQSALDGRQHAASDVEASAEQVEPHAARRALLANPVTQAKNIETFFKRSSRVSATLLFHYSRNTIYYRRMQQLFLTTQRR